MCLGDLSTQSLKQVECPGRIHLKGVCWSLPAFRDRRHPGSQDNRSGLNFSNQIQNRICIGQVETKGVFCPRPRCPEDGLSPAFQLGPQMRTDQPGRSEDQCGHSFSQSCR